MFDRNFQPILAFLKNKNVAIIKNSIEFNQNLIPTINSHDVIISFNNEFLNKFSIRSDIIIFNKEYPKPFLQMFHDTKFFINTLAKFSNNTAYYLSRKFHQFCEQKLNHKPSPEFLALQLCIISNAKNIDVYGFKWNNDNQDELATLLEYKDSGNLTIMDSSKVELLKEKSEKILLNKKFYDDIDIVSFDIFDTLICRPFIRPSDVFEYVGGKEFREKRIIAERSSREGVEETNIDRIYSFLNQEYQKYKEEEIETEIKICKGIKDNIEVLNFVKSLGKKVIITSDMYLPISVIRYILKENGIDNYDKLYLSSDIGCCKHNGKLFEYILKDLNVKPGRILHIGDNQHSDIIEASKYNIKTFKVKKVLDKLYEKNTRIKKLFPNSLAISYFIGKLAADFTQRSYWEQMGYTYGSMLAYPFLYYIKYVSTRDNVDTLIFAGRDGFILEKLYKDIDPSKKSIYAYANRKMAKSGKDYSYYFNNLGAEGKVAIVDSTTRDYSAQSVSRIKLGYYFWIREPFATTCVPDWVEGHSLAPRLKYSKIKSWELFETLIASPEPPVMDIDEYSLEPIYAEITPQEAYRIEIIKQINKGIVDFEFLPKLEYSFNDICNIMNNFLDNMSAEDIKEFNKVQFASEPDHKEYHTLMVRR